MCVCASEQCPLDSYIIVQSAGKLPYAPNDRRRSHFKDVIGMREVVRNRSKHRLKRRSKRATKNVRPVRPPKEH